MHELSITQELVKVVDEARRQAGDDAQVLRVVVTLGKLTLVVPDCLKFYYEVLTENTPMHGAELVFNLVPVKVKCKSCGAESEIEEARFICPSCSSTDTETVSGHELFVESIEVADEES